MFSSFFTPNKTPSPTQKLITLGPPDAHTFLHQLASIASAIYLPKEQREKKMVPMNLYSWDLPSEWKGEALCDDLGFKGKFFRYDPTTKDIERWIYAIRGTEFTNLQDVIGDIQIMFQAVPQQVIRAQKYCQEAVLDITQYYDPKERLSIQTKPFYIVGHSLGAVIASCVFADTGPVHKGRLQLVTFDNPGSYDIVKQHLMSYWKMSEADAIKQMNLLAPYVYNIVGDVNIINTCNKQWGNIYHLEHWNFNMGATYPPTTVIPKYYAANMHYLTSYLADQHSIDNIVQALSEHKPFNIKENHPEGLAQGYYAYLDGDARNFYWNQYFKSCWDAKPLLRKEHDDNYDNYIAHMFILLKAARGESLLVEDNIVKQEVVKFKMNNLYKLFPPKDEQKTVLITDSNNENYEFIDLGNDDVQKSTLSL